MQFQFKLNVGDTEITISDAAESQADFVKKVSFFLNLPKEGPNGEKDLKFLARNTAKGYYYSIRSEQADQEFQLGQSQKEPGELFPKKWEPIYHAPTEGVAAPVGGVGVGTSAPIATPQQVAAPVGVGVGVGAVNQPVPQEVPTQAPVTAQAPVGVQPAATPVNPQNQQVANNVFEQFGIK